MSLLRGLAVLGVFLPLASSFAAEPVVVLKNPSPVYPVSLNADNIHHGYAIVACSMDDDGTVLDLWVLDTSHLAFAGAAKDALKTWRYAPAANPANSANPAPWPRLDVVQFEFTQSGQISSKTHREAMLAAFPTPRPPASQIENLPVFPAARLTRLQGGPPVPPKATPAGEVIVEFLVDSTGRVNLPVAIQAQQSAHARAAVLAVRSWRFAALPPDMGAPVVRVRWGFRFPARS